MTPIAEAIHALLGLGYTIGEVKRRRVSCANEGRDGVKQHLYATHCVSDGNGGTAAICPVCVIVLGKEART